MYNVKQISDEIAQKIQGQSLLDSSIYAFFCLMKRQQSHYQFFELVGYGEYSIVLKTTNLGQSVALKVIECQGDISEIDQTIQNLHKSNGCGYITQIFNSFYLTGSHDSIDDENYISKQQSSNQPSQQPLFYVMEYELCERGFSRYEDFFGESLKNQFYDLYSVGIVLLELDNIATWDIAKLYLKNKFQFRLDIFSKSYQELDRESQIYTVVIQCLAKELSLIKILEQFIASNKQYLIVDIFTQPTKVDEGKLNYFLITQSELKTNKKFDILINILIKQKGIREQENIKNLFKEINKSYLEKDIFNLDLNLQTKSLLFEQILQINIVQITSFKNQGDYSMIFKGTTDIKDVSVKCLRIQDIDTILNLAQFLKNKIPKACQLIKSNTFYNFRTFKQYSYNLKQIMEYFFENSLIFSVEQIIQIALEISQAIQILSGSSISKINPSNIVYDELNNIFEISNFCTIKWPKDQEKLSSSYEDIYYAPEGINQENPALIKQFDIFCLGLIIFEMANGQFINDKQAAQIRSGNLSQFLSSKKTYSELNKIIQSMLTVDENERINLEKLIKQLNELQDINLKTKFKNQVQNVISVQKTFNNTKQYILNIQEFNFNFTENYLRLDQLECIVQEKLNFKEVSQSKKEDLNIHNLWDQKIYNTEVEKLIQSLLEKSQQITELNMDLSYKGLGQEGTKKIFEQLKKFKNLKQLTLDLRQNKINYEGAKFIAGFLNECQNVTCLDLNLSNNKIGDEGAKYIGMSLQSCQNITRLYLNLSSNQFGSEGAKNIGVGLLNPYNQAYLKLNLDLSQNRIREEGAKTIAQSLQMCQNIIILYLNLRCNGIGADGAKDIGMSLDKLQNLTTLDLDISCNDIGSDGAKHIGMNLHKLQNITTLFLDISCNDIGSDGAKHIGMSIDKLQNITTLILDISENNIREDGTILIGQSITRLRLNLRQNHIAVNGANNLRNMLEKCQNITLLQLFLSQNELGTEGAKLIGVSLEKCHNITYLELDLSKNQIQSEGAKFIRNSLEKCRNITSLHLNLDDNQIEDELLKNILTSIQKNISSKNIKTSQNLIYTQEPQKAQEAQKKQDSEKVVVLTDHIKNDYQKPILDQLFETILMKQQYCSQNQIEFQEILNVVGNCYYDLGESKQALKYLLEYQLVRNSQIKNKPDIEYACSLNMIGICYLNLNNSQKLVQYLLKSIQIYKKILNEKEFNISLYIENINSCQNQIKNLIQIQNGDQQIVRRKQVLSEIVLLIKEFERCYQNIKNNQISLKQSQLLQLLQKINQVKNLLIAQSLQYIGSLYLHLNDNQKALELQQESLELKKQDQSQNYLLIAKSLNEIGCNCFKYGNKQKSLSYSLECLFIQKYIYKMDEHPDIAQTLENIGRSHKNLGNNSKALYFYQKSLEIRKKIFNRNNFYIAQSLNNIGNCYFIVGNYQSALEYQLKSLEIIKQIYLTRHQSIVEFLNNVSSCYLKLKDNKKALVYQIESLEMLTKMIKLNSPQIASHFNNIGICYKNLNQNQKALQYLLKSLSIRKRIYKGNNLYVGESFMNVGSCYQSDGIYQTALEYFYQAIQIYSRIFQKYHKSIALCYDQISECNMKLGKYEIALQSLQRVLEIKKQIYKESNQQVPQCLNNIGYCYLELYQYKMAIMYYEESFELLKIQDNSDLKSNTLLFLKVCYHLLGDKQNSEKYAQYDFPQFQELVESYLLKLQKNSTQKEIQNKQFFA